jgi:NAD(P)-dependent dehydrogenase (short-subunit alcohol dehydrogenase family)
VTEQSTVASAGGAVVVVGGTRGIGRALASAYVQRGAAVVVTGRDVAGAARAADEVGAAVGLGIDLCEPHGIAAALREIGPVRRLVLAAIERDENTVRDYDVDRAVRLVTLKLVGYTEVVHQLADRLASDGSLLLFGGLASERPYEGSTTVTTVNGAVSTMVRTFALELEPVRVNALHPGIVADTDTWRERQAALDATLARTPTGRLVQTADVVDAALFLLENPAVNGVNLPLDGGWLLR